MNDKQLSFFYYINCSCKWQAMSSAYRSCHCPKYKDAGVDEGQNRIFLPLRQLRRLYNNLLISYFSGDSAVFHFVNHIRHLHGGCSVRDQNHCFFSAGFLQCFQNNTFI